MIVITTPTGDIGHQVLKHVVQGSESVRGLLDPSRIPQEIRQRIWTSPTPSPNPDFDSPFQRSTRTELDDKLQQMIGVTMRNFGKRLGVDR